MNRVALVTGSAKGIGAAIIRELAKNGYDCVINYNTSSLLANKLKEEILSTYKVKCLAIKADITNENEVDKMLNEIKSKIGEVDILINNAAVDLSLPFEEKTIDIFKKSLDVNVVSAYSLSKKVFSHMKENKWGRIINISSTNSMNSYFPMSLEYDASKAALNSLTHNLALEFKPYVNVNAIAPGLIGTEAELKDYDQEFMEFELSKILKRRYGDPKEVAYLVRFLVSEEADYINNTIIRIDGGQCGS